MKRPVAPGTMKDVAEFCRPLLEAIIAPADAETRAFLAPAIDTALGEIEWLCPVVMAVGPSGFSAAYGPTAEASACGVLVVIGTPTDGLTVGATGWPKVPELPSGVSVASLWKLIVDAAAEADQKTAMCALSCRIGDAALKDSQRRSKEIRRRGFTPVLVALAAGESGRYAGTCGIVAIPGSVESQLAAQGVSI